MRRLLLVALGLCLLTAGRAWTQDTPPPAPRFVLDSRDGFVTVLRDQYTMLCYAVTADHVALGKVLCKQDKIVTEIWKTNHRQGETRP